MSDAIRQADRDDLIEFAALVAELVVARLKPDPWLDKRGLAEHFACSTRSIEEAMAMGMPHAVSFGRAKFKLAECEPWLIAHGSLELRGERGMLNGTDKCPGSAEDAPGPDTRRNP